MASPPPAAAAAVERVWRRFTAQQRLARFAVYLAIVAAIVVSLRQVEVIPEFLYDAPEQVVDLLTRMWPIDWAAYPAEVHTSLVETLHIATLGTLAAAGAPLADAMRIANEAAGVVVGKLGASVVLPSELR